MFLFDATHTSHTLAQTGIQRVVRSLHRALAAQSAVQAVCLDPYLRGWRPLRADEARNLAPGGPPGGTRGARWTLGQKLAGHAARLARRRPALPPAEGIICPELFSTRVGARLPELFSSAAGPRVALFHDAIGLQFPELTPPATVARLPAYLRELLQFDGIAAVSADSAASLREYWDWLGVRNAPEVRAIPLGVESLPPGSNRPPASDQTVRILCVATIEGRKNHLALLAACDQLWTEGQVFALELVGLGRPETGADALRALKDLRARGRAVRWTGGVTDAELHEAYRRSTFTVYPSLKEGFGLPVLESLQHGRPCACSGAGALGESAAGGGCEVLAGLDAPGIAATLRALLTDAGKREALAAAARARVFRTWPDYAAELIGWMKSLRRRR